MNLHMRILRSLLSHLLDSQLLRLLIKAFAASASPHKPEPLISDPQTPTHSPGTPCNLPLAQASFKCSITAGGTQLVKAPGPALRPPSQLRFLP